MSHTYSIEVNGQQRTFFSVTSLIDLFSELNFFEDKVYYRRDSDAAEIGKIGHECIAQVLSNQPILKEQWESLDERVKNMVRGVLRWEQKSHFVAKEIEPLVYSVRYCYAGRPDAIGNAYGMLTIPDWKSGILNLIRLKYQLVMYLVAYLELHPRRKIDRLIGVYLDKQTGAFKEVIIEKDEINDIFQQVLGFMERIDVSMLQDMAGTNDIRKFRDKKVLGGQITMTSSQGIIKRQQEGHLAIADTERYKDVMEFLANYYPYSGVADRIKVAQYLHFYRVPPDLIYLIPYRNKGRAKAIGCECESFEECVHKDKGIYDWAMVRSEKARWMIASHGRTLVEVEPTHIMSEAEEIKYYAKVDPTKIRAVAHIKDLKSGAEVYGFGHWIRGKYPKGTDKGNSAEDMAILRAGTKACNKLPPAEGVAPIAPSIAESDEDATDNNYVNGDFSALDEKTGEIMPVGTITTPDPSQPTPCPAQSENQPQTIDVVVEKPAPQKTDYTAMLTTCPLHNVKWRIDNYKRFYHPHDGDFCRLKNIAKDMIDTIRKERGIKAERVNQILTDNFGPTWAKLDNMQTVKAIDLIATISLDAPVMVDTFEQEADAFLSQLKWTREHVLERYPNCSKLTDLSEPQRKDLLNHLADQIAAGSEQQPALPLS